MTQTPFTTVKMADLLKALFGRLIPVADLPELLSTVDALCAQAFDDETESGNHRYSADARVSYPNPDREFTVEDSGYCDIWMEALWAWREMLTPDDLAMLNEETVVFSEVSP